MKGTAGMPFLEKHQIAKRKLMPLQWIILTHLIATVWKWGVLKIVSQVTVVIEWSQLKMNGLAVHCPLSLHAFEIVFWSSFLDSLPNSACWLYHLSSHLSAYSLYLSAELLIVTFGSLCARDLLANSCQSKCETMASEFSFGGLQTAEPLEWIFWVQTIELFVGSDYHFLYMFLQNYLHYLIKWADNSVSKLLLATFGNIRSYCQLTLRKWLCPVFDRTDPKWDRCPLEKVVHGIFLEVNIEKFESHCFVLLFV